MNNISPSSSDSSTSSSHFSTVSNFDQLHLEDTDYTILPPPSNDVTQVTSSDVSVIVKAANKEYVPVDDIHQ